MTIKRKQNFLLVMTCNILMKKVCVRVKLAKFGHGDNLFNQT